MNDYSTTKETSMLLALSYRIINNCPYDNDFDPFELSLKLLSLYLQNAENSDSYDALFENAKKNLHFNSFKSKAGYLNSQLPHEELLVSVLFLQDPKNGTVTDDDVKLCASMLLDGAKCLLPNQKPLYDKLCKSGMIGHFRDKALSA